MKVMFADAAQDIDYQSFLSLIDSRLRDLERNSFRDDEVRSFK